MAQHDDTREPISTPELISVLKAQIPRALDPRPAIYPLLVMLVFLAMAVASVTPGTDEGALPDLPWLFDVALLFAISAYLFACSRALFSVAFMGVLSTFGAIMLDYPVSLVVGIAGIVFMAAGGFVWFVVAQHYARKGESR